jgi:Transglutaminase-like superfamily
MSSFMKLRRKLATFLGMSAASRRLVCEAIIMLGMARFVVIAVPFRLMAPWLSRAPHTSCYDEGLLLRVRQAVTTAAHNVPWDAVCLPQAIAAKAMLARRGCGSSLHLGANLNAQGKLSAHAWLVAGGTVVVGAAGIRCVTPLARFG